MYTVCVLLSLELPCEVQSDDCTNDTTRMLCYECMRYVCKRCCQRNETGAICIPCLLEKEIDYDVV
jgi:hypothetical protein